MLHILKRKPFDSAVNEYTHGNLLHRIQYHVSFMMTLYNSHFRIDEHCINRELN